MQDSEILEQIKKRRTFAIISHPDAGKTTLTEKLLLYIMKVLLKTEKYLILLTQEKNQSNFH